MTSLARFDQEREILDQALSNDGYLEIECQSYGGAIALRRRCNHFRALDRDENSKLFSPGEKTPSGFEPYGQSAYDDLILSIPKKGQLHDNTIFVRPRSKETYQIRAVRPGKSDPDAGSKTVK